MLDLGRSGKLNVPTMLGALAASRVAVTPKTYTPLDVFTLSSLPFYNLDLL